MARSAAALPQPSEPITGLGGAGGRGAIGERATLSRPSPISRTAHVVFVRCHALATIQLASSTTDIPEAGPDAFTVDIVRAHATRLDNRLQPVICP